MKNISVLASVVCVLAGAPMAFAQAAPAYSPPKTSWGVPDLQGTFSTASITTMQRPAGASGLIVSDEEAAKLLMVSFDSTLKANLSVGLPFDLQVVPVNAFHIGFETRIKADDPYYNEVSRGWGNALKQAFKSLPEYSIPLYND